MHLPLGPPREEQFKHGRNHEWCRWWCCSNHRCRCRDLLSTTTTFTSAAYRGSGLGASQPAMDEIKQTLTEEEKNTGSSLPGTSAMSPKFYVRVFIRNSPPLLLCSSHVLSSAFLFCFDTQDPNDSTTFPEDQGALQSPAIRQGPVPSHNASTQGSREYHSLPTV